MAIFSSSPSMIKSSQKSGYGYVQLLTSSSAFFLQAPLTGIVITLAVDYNINKTMDGNFNILTFLDHPVVILLTGLLCIAVALCNSAGKVLSAKKLLSKMSDFYDKYKLPKRELGNPTISLTIAQSNYLAVVLSLRREANPRVPGTMLYSLTLYGVKKANG